MSQCFRCWEEFEEAHTSSSAPVIRICGHCSAKVICDYEEVLWNFLGSRGAPWGSFTVSGGRGDLKSVADLESMFRKLGVSNDVPVVVYGSWKEEWGEEGRIFWQLEWLGHKDVRILYGGMRVVDCYLYAVRV